MKFILLADCRCGGNAIRTALDSHPALKVAGELLNPLEHGYGPGQKGKGIGDTVAKVINTATDGRLKPCGGCGERRKKLNELSE